MKKHLLYCAAAALICSACHNESEDFEKIQPQNAVSIRIGQKVEGLTARAAVDNGSQVSATILTIGYDSQYDASVWNGFAPQYTNVLDQQTPAGLATPANVSTATFIAGTKEAMNLQPTLYYYDKGTAVLAVSPAGTINGANVEMTLTDGEQDVMYAKAVEVASKPQDETTAQSTPVSLTFEHKTTQLNFAFKMEAAASSGAWTGKSISVKNITIQNASVPESVKYSDGKVNFSTPGTNLDVPGIVAGNAVTAEAKKVGRPVMVDASSDIKLNVVLTIGSKDYTFSNVQVMRTETGHESERLTTVIGSSHLITLTIKEPVKPDGAIEITTQATVKPWVSGEGGSGTLE